MSYIAAAVVLIIAGAVIYAVVVPTWIGLAVAALGAGILIVSLVDRKP